MQRRRCAFARDETFSEFAQLPYDLEKRGRELFYEREGRWVRVERIITAHFRRIIRGGSQPPFSFSDDPTCTGGHPNWYSKAQTFTPFLRPSTRAGLSPTNSGGKIELRSKRLLVLRARVDLETREDTSALEKPTSGFSEEVRSGNLPRGRPNQSRNPNDVVWPERSKPDPGEQPRPVIREKYGRDFTM